MSCVCSRNTRHRCPFQFLKYLVIILAAWVPLRAMVAKHFCILICIPNSVMVLNTIRNCFRALRRLRHESNSQWQCLSSAKIDMWFWVQVLAPAESVDLILESKTLHKRMVQHAYIIGATLQPCRSPRCMPVWRDCPPCSMASCVCA